MSYVKEDNELANTPTQANCGYE